MWSDEEYYCYSPDYADSDSDDDAPFFMDDDDYYYDSGSDGLAEIMLRKAMSEASKLSENKISENEAGQGKLEGHVFSLVDICSRFIALRFPFGYIEGRYPPVPDEVQLKIISYSFPENEALVKKYAEFSRSGVDFVYPRNLCSRGAVTNMCQIGFRLSASVDDRRYSSARKGKCYVTIQFDRGKITAAHCSCDTTTDWCNHVIAVILQRINHKEQMKIQLRVPISDSLNVLNREQLLKFTQYLLCEHQNEPIIETAQTLLDRLLHPERERESEGDTAQVDDINDIDGAPDPTAGPGLEDESHWFVCHKGFKSRCDNIMYESFTDLGFEQLDTHEDLRTDSASIHELWTRSRNTKQALIRDDIELQYESDSYYGGTSSRNKELLQVLQTIADLLQDDPVSAVSALSTCTEQIVSKLTSRVDTHRVAIYGRPSGSSSGSRYCSTPKTSLAMGFTPRPFSCWTLTDELARLWRLSVLNPKMSGKHRQEVLTNLANWCPKVTEGCHSANLLPWHGLQVARQLGEFDWNNSDIKAVLQRKLLCRPRISSYAVVHLSCKSSNKRTGLKRKVSGYSNVQPELHSEVTLRKNQNCSPRPTVSFNLPLHVSFGSQVMDIHTCCSLIEALHLYKHDVSAVKLSLCLAVSLIAHFKEETESGKGTLDLPAAHEFDLGMLKEENVLKNDEASGSGDLPMEVDEDTSAVCGAAKSEPLAESRTEVWPQGTVPSAATFAFLHDVMSKNHDVLESCITEAKSSIGGGEESDPILSNVDSAKSLMFQLGVVGLLIPRFPSPTHLVEVEQFDYENWLTHQLVTASPTEHDREVLVQVAHFICRRSHWPCSPPCSLGRVIFHHLFKGVPESLGDELVSRQKLGLQVAFHILEYAKPCQPTSTSWGMFFYSVCRHWWKLAEVVLKTLPGCPNYLDKAMAHVLQADGFVGVAEEKVARLKRSAEIGIHVYHEPQRSQTQLESAVMDIKAKVAFSLAKILGSKSSRTHIEAIVSLTTKSSGHGYRTYSGMQTVRIELPRKPRDDDNSLDICAITLGAHSALLSKLSEREYMRRNTVKWLIPIAVECSCWHEGIMCLMSCQGGVENFMTQNEVLDLCDKMLKKNDKSCHELAKNALLTQVHLAIQQPSKYKMRDILTFCRKKQSAIHSNWFPWLCQELQRLALSCEVPFDVLIETSQSMFDFYKNKLEEEDAKIQREEEKDHQGGLQRSLADLFGEDAVEEEEEFVSIPQLENPYRTPEPHPFLEIAYDLGLLATGCAGRQRSGEEGRRDIRRGGVKNNLREFSRNVCYLVKKSWLQRRDTKLPSASGRNEDAVDVDAPFSSPYLERFISCLINTVENPCWLFEVLEELASYLHPDLQAYDTEEILVKQETEDQHIVTVCRKYSMIQLLLEKSLDAFTEVLVGPQVDKLVEDLTNRRPRCVDPKVLMVELKYASLGDGTGFRDVLRTAKKAFTVFDDSKKTFENVLQEMEARHPELKLFLDGIRKGDNERYETRFSSGMPAAFLPYLQLMGARNPLEEWLF